jgi:hypothetical protein
VQCRWGDCCSEPSRNRHGNECRVLTSSLVGTAADHLSLRRHSVSQSQTFCCIVLSFAESPRFWPAKIVSSCGAKRLLIGPFSVTMDPTSKEHDVRPTAPCTTYHELRGADRFWCAHMAVTHIPTVLDESQVSTTCITTRSGLGTPEEDGKVAREHT